MNQPAVNFLIKKDYPLNHLLKEATAKDLHSILHLILDNNIDRWFSDKDTRQKLVDYRRNDNLRDITDSFADLLEREICLLASNTLTSMLHKDKPVSYDNVVWSVAKELKIDIPENDIKNQIFELENAIVQSMGSVNYSSRGKQIKDSFRKYGLMGAATLISRTNLLTSVGTSLALMTYEKSKPAFEIIIPVIKEISRIRTRLMESEYQRFIARLKEFL